MDDRAELIERLEKLTEPDRLTDAWIEVEARRQQAYAVGLNDQTRAKWQPIGNRGEVEEGGTRYHAPEYTRSIDATIALVEKIAPDQLVAIVGKAFEMCLSQPTITAKDFPRFVLLALLRSDKEAG